MLPSDENRPASILSCWSDETIIHTASENSASHDSSASRPCFLVKRLYRKQSESHREFIKRASSEYCISSVLSHINVVGALNLLMENYSFCMVMNLVEMGDPLSSIIKSNHMTIPDIVNYFKQLAQATHYIQDLGIVHRDMRPENILIFPGGNLKLTGFGNAFVFRSPLQNHHLKVQGRVGVLAYQPPESLLWWGHCVSSSPGTYLCVKNKYHTVGDDIGNEGYCASAVDIWSMGVVLLYMLKSHLPWSIPCPYHDSNYACFLTYNQQRPLPLILSLPLTHRYLIYRMLDPNHSSRIVIQQLITNI